MEKATHLRRRLDTDTQTKLVRYKLYKSGKLWLISSSATILAALVLTSHPLVGHADTGAPAETATESVMVGVDNEVTETDTTDTTDTTTTEPTLTSLTPTLNNIDEPTTAPMTDSTEPQSVPVVDSTLDSSPATPSESLDTTSTITATTDVPASTPVTESQPTPSAPQPSPTARAARATTPVTPTPKAAQLTAPNAELVNVTQYIKDLAPENLAKYGWYLSPSGYYTRITAGDYEYIGPDAAGTSAAEQALAQTLFKQPIFPKNYQIWATNTRMNNGKLELTRKSVITVQILPTTLTPPKDIRFIGPATVTMTTSNSTSTAAKTANIAGAPGAFDLYGPVSTIPQAVTLPLSSTGDKYQTTIYVSTHLGLPAFVIQNGAFIADHTVYLGRAQASTHQLTPTIADRPTANGTLSGTGTGVGNKIFIKSLDGRKTQLTVVKADGSWQADLTASGFLATDDLYVIETNDLGDLPGAAVQPRYATVTRVVNGVNAVTKEDLGTLTTQTQSLVQRAKVTAIDANQLQNPDGIKDGSAITVDWQSFTNLDGSPASFSAISMATIANPDAAHLIAQTADLPSIAAAAGKTVTQTAVYYPKIITVSGQHTSNPSDPLTQGFAPIEAGSHLLATDNLSPVLAGGLGAADLYQVIHQTIHYVDAKTQTTVAPDHHTNLPLYREVTVNLEQYLANPATGLTYSDWKRVDIPSSTTFDAVTSPTVPGMVPAMLSYPAISFEANQGEQVATIGYYAAQVTVSAEQPQVAGTAVSADLLDPRRYPDGLTTNDLKKVVTETIHHQDYQTNKALAPDTTQTLTFT